MEINIVDFIEGYNKQDSNSDKEKYLKATLEVKSYVDYLVKVGCCEKLVKLSVLDKSGNIKFNSTISYLLMNQIIIEQYTNLKVEKGSGFFKEYDALRKSDLLTVILSKIPESEIQEFYNIFEMIKNDYIDNYTCSHNFGYKISDFMDTIIKQIKDSFNQLSVEEKAKFVSEFNTMVTKLNSMKDNK